MDLKIQIRPNIDQIRTTEYSSIPTTSLQVEVAYLYFYLANVWSVGNLVKALAVTLLLDILPG
jgi:hypothetical protein